MEANRTLTPVLDLRHLRLELDGRSILDDVSLAVREGEHLAIVGPNGAGKTCLLKCVNRILRGWRGMISVHGVSIAAYSQRELGRLVAYVPQVGGRPAPFTARETVLMARYPHLTPFAAPGLRDQRYVEDALALTGIGALADRTMDTLSGGERQKVFLAAALAQDARLLLLDEPTTFLDPRHRDDFRRVLRTVNRRKGVTVVEVTHDLNCAVLDADRIFALKDGRAAFCGPPEQFMVRDVMIRVFDRTFLTVNHPTTGQPVILPEVGEP